MPMLAARTIAGLRAISRLASSAARARAFHASAAQEAITKMTMPAMSPTMTEGGLSEWKVKEGQPFSQGDVLLDIETDKATMDVEAPEDGVLAKILVGNGSKDVPVGKAIALLAEEGDDLSNIEVPQEDSPAPAPTPAPASGSPADATAPASTPSSAPPSPVGGAGGEVLHAPPGGPYLPSVARLLAEKHVTDPSQIKGTGLHGRLTKGDVLAFLGEASSPTGTFKPQHGGIASLYAQGSTPASPAGNASASSKDKPKAPEPVRASSVETDCECALVLIET